MARVVAPQDDEVVEVASLEADPAVHRVVPGDLAVGHAEPDGERRARAARARLDLAGASAGSSGGRSGTPVPAASARARCASSSSRVQKQR